MERITKIFALLLVFSVVFMNSCKKDEELGTATPEQAQQIISDAGTQMEQDMGALMTADGMQSVLALSELDAPFIGEIMGSVPLKSIKSIKDLKNIKVKGENEDYGTYTWNPNYYGAGVGGWEWSSLPADELVMLFPTQGSLTNNAVLTISMFTFTTVSDEWDTWDVPTRIVGNIKVDNVTQVSIDITASWTTDGMPLSLVFDVYLNPYTISGSFSTTSNSASLNVSVTQGSTTLIAANVTATFTGTAMEDSPSNIEGYLQVRNLKLQGNLQIAAMENLMETSYDPTPEQINALFSLTLVDTESGSRLGDFMVVEDEFGYSQLAFVYTDGTVADDEFTAQLSDMIESMVGGGK